MTLVYVIFSNVGDEFTAIRAIFDIQGAEVF